MKKMFTNIGQIMIIITALIFLSSCVSQTIIADEKPPSDSLPNNDVLLEDFGPAPELSGSTWINTDASLSLANLRGKVVLIDFWTFG